ncbi:iron-containing alcohol dehydrogenase family protein [Haladaptatus salinisoli]|uniref:iron-containing alcohol dehydrogenase family protein n=1 Tax=Haladaptatus salinisoli TaxID=2884876 RepID=UPI001D0A468A|nr:iron-containing alcohol dehydrogenase [Haladaptatus salinisoli]
MPNRIVFGSGAADEIGSYIEQFDAEQALIVTDEGVREADVLDPVLESIEAAGKEYTIFDGVQPDPTDTVVHEAADAYDDADADLVLGIGGGSSLDTAKAASIVVANGGRILDFKGSGNVPKSPPPSIYVPTTSGTGSEVGHWCIVKDSETNIKEEIGDVKLLADLALIDPNLTASAPPPVKAATGMDVLTHAIEAYVSIKAQSQTSAIALDSIEKVGENLTRAVEYRNGDLTALTAMARASMQAGMAFNGAGLGAVHALSHQVGGQFGVPHGLVNAILLPYVMEYNLPQVPEKFCNIAAALGESIDYDRRTQLEAHKAVRAVRELGDSVRIPVTLDATAAERDAIPQLAEQALDDGSLTGNPRITDQDDMEWILNRAFDGTFEYESRL